VTLISDLAIAVACGIIFESLCFLFQVKNSLKINKDKLITSQEKYTASYNSYTSYHPDGKLFFVSTKKFESHFIIDGQNSIIIDMEKLELIDSSSIITLADVAERYKSAGKHVQFINVC
jgi:SulP family sulfate permease